MAYLRMAAMILAKLLMVYLSLYSLSLMTPYLYLADPALPTMVIGAFNLRDLIRPGRLNLLRAGLRDLAVMAIWIGCNLAIIWIGHAGQPVTTAPNPQWASLAVVVAFGLFDAGILYRRAGATGRRLWRASWR